MQSTIPFLVIIMVWIFMDPPDRRDYLLQPEIDYFKEKLIELTPHIEMSQDMIKRIGKRIRDQNLDEISQHMMLMRLGEDIAEWSWNQFGYAPSIMHNHKNVTFILFQNEDDAMHFFMRWL